MLTVHGPVLPRDNFVQHISNASWKRGVGTYFWNEIPFSYTTGYDWAERLVRWMLERKKNDSTPIRILELGAGSGILSKHMMHALEIHAPDRVRTAKIILSDISEEQRNDVQNTTFFKTYSDHLDYICMDLMHPNLDGLEKMDLICMSYGLDVIPPIRVTVTNDIVTVTAHAIALRDDAEMINTLDALPTVYQNDALVKKVANLTPDEQCAMSNQLMPFIIDTESEHPIGDLLSSSECEEVHQIIDYLKSHDSGSEPLHEFAFHYIPNISNVMKQYCEQLKPNGSFLIYDFGFSKTQRMHPTEWHAQYEAVRFYAVNFDVLHVLSRQKGFGSHVEQLDSAYNFLHISTPQPLTDEDIEMMQNIFSTNCRDELNDAIQQIKEQSLTAKNVEMIYSRLSQNAQKSYLLNYIIAEGLESNGEDEAALTFLDASLENYSDIALASYKLMGKIYQKNGQKEKAIEAFTYALAIYPNDDLASHHLGMMAANDGDYVLYRQYMKSFYDSGTTAGIWNYLISIALMAIQEGDEKNGRALLEHVEKQHKAKTANIDR